MIFLRVWGIRDTGQEVSYEKDAVQLWQVKFDAYFEWCKQHEQANKELLAKEKQEDRMADEWHWWAEYELHQEEMCIRRIEAEALHALALNRNKDKEQ